MSVVNLTNPGVKRDAYLWLLHGIITGALITIWPGIGKDAHECADPGRK